MSDDKYGTKSESDSESSYDVSDSKPGETSDDDCDESESET